MYGALGEEGLFEEFFVWDVGGVFGDDEGEELDEGFVRDFCG